MRTARRAAILATLLAGGTGAAQDLDRDSSALVDRHLRELWTREELRPARRADDFEYLRRLCLDLVGETPHPDEIREFIHSDRPDKRSAKVETLLASRAFDLSWAERMSLYLLGYPRQFDYFTDRRGFRDWLRNKLREPGARMDEIARDILTASTGDENFVPTAFLGQFAEFGGRTYALRIEQLAGRAATAFLGTRIQCAQCHDHPFDRWTQEEFAGMAAFFAKTSYRADEVNRGVADRKTPVAYKFEGLKGELVPRFLDGAEPKTDDWRAEFARMTVGDPRFARAFVNRVWAWFFGKGIVDPLDDMTEARKPVAPALLDALAKDFAARDFNIRHLIRTICNSDAYQRTSRRAGEEDPRVEKLFARARVRPLTPHQLWDTILRQTDLKDADSAVDDDAVLELLGGQNAAMAESRKLLALRTWFLDMLVKTSDEAAGTNFSAYSANIQQVLHLLNRDLPLYTGAKNGTGGRLHKLLEGKSDEDAVTELFLSTVSRFPNARERGRSLEHLKLAGERVKAFEDVFWALLNTDEFIFNH